MDQLVKVMPAGCLYYKMAIFSKLSWNPWSFLSISWEFKKKKSLYFSKCNPITAEDI